MQSYQNSNKIITAMTLIEVLVALTIVSFVFASLTQMTFTALRRTKNLELQDKMRNYATEAVQILYNQKDTNWDSVLGDSGELPPVVPNTGSTYTQAYVAYDSSISIKNISTGDCEFNEEERVLIGTNCELTSGNEQVTDTNPVLFGRLIRRFDDNQPDANSLNQNRDFTTDAEIEIIVACIEGKCKGEDFTPFKLNLTVYRTSGQ